MASGPSEVSTNPTTSLQQGKVERIDIHSEAMDKSIPASVYLPQVYFQDSTRRFPSVYVLHGYSGEHGSWLELVPEIKDWADRFDQILVFPDGQYNAWYLDSPRLDSDG